MGVFPQRQQVKECLQHLYIRLDLEKHRLAFPGPTKQSTLSSPEFSRRQGQDKGKDEARKEEEEKEEEEKEEEERNAQFLAQILPRDTRSLVDQLPSVWAGIGQGRRERALEKVDEEGRERI